MVMEWLEQRFAHSAVLVIGFSGADLDLGGDYLRLMVASDRIPWLRWLVRPGQDPHPKAKAIVDSCGARGGFVVGDLPSALTGPGISVPTVEIGATSGQDRRLA